MIRGDQFINKKSEAIAVIDVAPCSGGCALIYESNGHSRGSSEKQFLDEWSFTGVNLRTGLPLRITKSMIMEK